MSKMFEIAPFLLKMQNQTTHFQQLVSQTFPKLADLADLAKLLIKWCACVHVLGGFRALKMHQYA